MATEVKNQTVIAENVEVDIEDLRLATGWSFFNRPARTEAAMKVVEAVIKSLDPSDRHRLEEEE